MTKKRYRVYFLIFILGVFAIKVYESRVINFLWAKADMAFHLGKYNIAERYLGRIIKLNPSEVDAYVLKAWLEWSEAVSKNDMKKLSSAVKTLRMGQWYNPFDYKLYLEEGIMWNAVGNNEEALKSFKILYIVGGVPYARLYPHKLKQMGKTYEAYKAMKKIYEKHKDELTLQCLEKLKKEITT